MSGNLLYAPRIYTLYLLIGLMFPNGQAGQVSYLGQVIPKTQKMVVTTFLLNTQHYQVGIKNKV